METREMSNNTTTAYTYSSSGDCFNPLRKTFIILQSSEAVATTLVNTTVLIVYGFIKTRQRKISNYLLFNQAIVDLYMSLSLWYELVLLLIDIKRNQQYLLVINIGMLEYSLLLSLGTLLMGAVERYLSITKSFYHKRNITLLRLAYATVLLWLISSVPSFVLLSLMGFDNNNSEDTYVNVYSYMFDAALVCIVFLIVYLIAMTLRKARSSCSLQVLSSESYSNPNRRQKLLGIARRKHTRLLVIFLIMIGAYILTFLPFILGRIAYDAGTLEHVSKCNQMAISFLCLLFYKSSSLFNPFLTLFLKKDYRKTLRNLLRGRIKFLLTDDDSFKMELVCPKSFRTQSLTPSALEQISMV